MGIALHDRVAGNLARKDAEEVLAVQGHILWRRHPRKVQPERFFPRVSEEVAEAPVDPLPPPSAVDLAQDGHPDRRVLERDAKDAFVGHPSGMGWLPPAVAHCRLRARRSIQSGLPVVSPCSRRGGHPAFALSRGLSCEMGRRPSGKSFLSPDRMFLRIPF